MSTFLIFLVLHMILIREIIKTLLWVSTVFLDFLTHQLSCQQGHVLNDGQADPPLRILCQFHNGRQQRLGELTDANHLVHTVEVGDDVETHLRALHGEVTG